MTYFEKNEQKHFFPMFSMLNAIGGISNIADFTTPCVNITNSAFSQLPGKMRKQMKRNYIFPNCMLRLKFRTHRWVAVLTTQFIINPLSIWGGGNIGYQTYKNERVKEKQVTRGHNIVADGWARASNPIKPPSTPQTPLHTYIHPKSSFIHFFTQSPTDQRKDGRTKPLIDSLVRD